MHWVWVSAVLLLLAALAAVYFRSSPSREEPTWSSVLAPEQTKFAYFAGPVAVSHDGRKLAFVATTLGGEDVVWVRPWVRQTPRPYWAPKALDILFGQGTIARLVSSPEESSKL